MRKRVIGVYTLLLFLSAAPQQGLSAQATGAVVHNPQASPVSPNRSAGAASTSHREVPKGEVFQFNFKSSRVFPNTARTITIYVPAEYKSGTPACVYVGLDGLGFNAPTVFDSLIAEHRMPVTVGVGISPGTVDAVPRSGSPRFDRSFEFDSLSGRLASFILDEVLPAVEEKHTADGRRIQLSSNPDDRMIGGASTGGIGALNVAWQRPDGFHRVFTAIGTFVGMRGGESFYVMVRKTEPKPIRIFMQDGSNDEWPGGPEMGDWWMSNQTMERALEFAGYDVKHVWGEGGHSDEQASAIFPDAVAWLFRDWPQPVRAGASGNPALAQILKPQQGWSTLSENCPSAMRMAVDEKGALYLAAPRGRLIRADGAAVRQACAESDSGGQAAFGPAGAYYFADVGNVEMAATGDQKNAGILASGIAARQIAVQVDGSIYVTAIGAGGQGEIWYIKPDGSKRLVAKNVDQPTGISISPDRLWMIVLQGNSSLALSYRILPDGSLDSVEPFYILYAPAATGKSGSEQVVFDREGRAYVATALGIQVMDHNGRVVAIVPLPGDQPAMALSFGGADFHTLYVSDGKHLFARTFRTVGSEPWDGKLPVPSWGPG